MRSFVWHARCFLSCTHEKLREWCSTECGVCRRVSVRDDSTVRALAQYGVDLMCGHMGCRIDRMQHAWMPYKSHSGHGEMWLVVVKGNRTVMSELTCFCPQRITRHLHVHSHSHVCVLETNIQTHQLMAAHTHAHMHACTCIHMNTQTRTHPLLREQQIQYTLHDAHEYACISSHFTGEQVVIRGGRANITRESCTMPWMSV